MGGLEWWSGGRGGGGVLVEGVVGNVVAQRRNLGSMVVVDGIRCG